MHIRVAVFEDNLAHMQRLCDALNAWACQHGHTLSVFRHTSPIAFSESDADSFDIIMLDINMPDQTGIEFAHEIQQIDKTIPLVFTSDYVEYGLQGYEVGAVRFLNKNDTRFDSKFCECMDCVLSLVLCNDKSTYTLKNNGMHISILCSEILYLEVYDHMLHIHTLNGLYTERKTIEEASKLPPKQFFRCSRSFIVNIQHASCASAKEIQLVTNERLIVTKPYSQSIIDAFLKFH